MSVKFVRNDITKVKADVIVDTANPYPIIGNGTDKAIYKAAGEEKLLKERKKIGNIERGDAAITSGFNLSKYIIHTVGPKYIDGTHNEEKTLRSCYKKSLKLAKDNQCNSIAFPLISTGVYGFPKEDAVSIALSEINDFLIKERNLDVTIVVFDDESFIIGNKVFQQMETFIDSKQSKESLENEYGKEGYESIKNRAKRPRINKSSRTIDSNNSYDDQKSFNEMIYYYLCLRDEKASVLYKRAGIDRKLWSKIMNNDYHPSKNTAIRICFALGLTLNQSIDLLSRADYAFNPSKPEDTEIMNCLRWKISFDETVQHLKELNLYL